MSCWNLSFDEQTYKQPAQSTTKKHNKLTYADDIHIVGRSQSAVRDVYLALEREAAKVGLKINEQKQNIGVQPGIIGRFVTWGKA
jgi:hypothetical protein